MASKITKEVVEAMEGLSPLDFHKATRIGDAFGVPAKSIVASAGRRGIEYIRKPRVSKSGDPVTTKEDLVKAIATKVGLGVAEVEGLSKATKVALARLADAL